MSEIMMESPQGREMLPGFVVSDLSSTGLLLATSIEINNTKCLSSQSIVTLPGGHSFVLTDIADGSGLYVPEKGEIIGIDRRESEIQRVSEAELLQYAVVSESETRQRSGSEIALAADNPMLFLRKEVEAKGIMLTEGIDEIFGHLQVVRPTQEGPYPYSAKVLARHGSISEKGDQSAIDPHVNEIAKTEPGDFEKIALTAMELVDEPQLRREADMILFFFPRVLRNYRLHQDVVQERPEMPDLTMKIIDVLSGTHVKNTRAIMYSLLDELSIPLSMHEALLGVMDKHHDLHHPFAFQLTMELAKEKPESSWIKTQQERRAKLLPAFEGSAQALFDQYDELMRMTEGLVYSGDLTSDDKGKIGLEIEFALDSNRKSAFEEYDSYYPDPVLRSSIRNDEIHAGWEFSGIADESDSMVLELRRDENRLTYNLDYELSVVKLSQWLSDHATHIASVHYHLDRPKHPHKPNLGNLYTYDVIGKLAVHESSDLSTWELRGFDFPEALGSLHSGRIADTIQFLIAAASENTGVEEVEEKIKLSDQVSNVSFEQIIWGHLSSVMQSSTGRLSAFMALYSDRVFRNANPLAFFHTYERKDLEAIATAVKDKSSAPYQKEMVDYLRSIGRGDFSSKQSATINAQIVCARTLAGALQELEVIGDNSQNPLSVEADEGHRGSRRPVQLPMHEDIFVSHLISENNPRSQREISLISHPSVETHINPILRVSPREEVPLNFLLPEDNRRYQLYENRLEERRVRPNLFENNIRRDYDNE